MKKCRLTLHPAGFRQRPAGEKFFEASVPRVTLRSTHGKLLPPLRGFI